MYGTVARMKVKAGMEGKLVEITRSYEGLKIPGHRTTHVYKLDSGNNEYILTAVFDSREAYHKNANDPAQNARYQAMRALLDADPEWNDGEIIYSGRKTPGSVPAVHSNIRGHRDDAGAWAALEMDRSIGPDSAYPSLCLTLPGHRIFRAPPPYRRTNPRCGAARGGGDDSPIRYTAQGPASPCAGRPSHHNSTDYPRLWHPPIRY